MQLILTSDLSVESAYPLFKKDNRVPNIHFLGKRVVERVVEQARESGLSDIVVMYRGALELGGSLPSSSYAYWPEEVEEEIEALAMFLSELKSDRVILQIGSHYTSPSIYRFLLSKWSEIGGSLFTLLTSSLINYPYGIGGLRASIDFQTNRVIDAGMGKEGYGVTGLVSGERLVLLDELRSSESLLDFLLRVLESYNLRAYVWSEEFVHLNEPRSLLVAIKAALRALNSVIIRPGAKISPTSVIEGPVYIDEEAVVDHYAVIKGPVYIGKRAFIGSHTLIRNSVSIEAGGVIGSGAEVKRSYIGMGASIGSKTYLADSLVGEGALVRPFTITINYDPEESRKPGFEKMGSVIGERSVVEAGSVLRPRTIIEPESFYKGPSK